MYLSVFISILLVPQLGVPIHEEMEIKECIESSQTNKNIKHALPISLSLSRSLSHALYLALTGLISFTH